MITSISPLDGRYETKVHTLQNYFSEFALIKYRIKIEIEWFIFLSTFLDDMQHFSEEEIDFLRNIYTNLTVSDAEIVKNIEKITNHDVKAVEYFLRDKIKRHSNLSKFSEFIHFACTSEDINNLSYASMIYDALNSAIFPKMAEFIEQIIEKAKKYKSITMLSRTHGQAASPTTMGKEFINVAYRFKRKLDHLKTVPILGKINGAVGNFNAHLVAYPNINWLMKSEEFVTKTLSLKFNLLTTQIEPHDFIAEISHKIKEFNTVMIDFNRDIWGYISQGYFKQKLKSGEVGSSTMPHKVNPIDFENSEGNSGLAISLLNHFAEKLPISRWQRDLTDSTVFRNIGIGFAHTYLAIDSCLKGLKKIKINEKTIDNDLDKSWEILAEPIQTIMRRYKIENAYEKLKTLTRGHTISQSNIRTFVQSLDIPKDAIKRLSELTPKNYIGDAINLVDEAIKRYF